MKLSSVKKCRGLAIALGALLLGTPVFARQTIGIILKFNSGDFWGAVEQGAKEAAQAADVDLVVKAYRDSSNFTVQLRFLEGLINQQVDAIVVAPANPLQMAAPLKAWVEKGVKIVVAETQLPENTLLPFVGLDQTKLSIAAAKAFAEAVEDRDEVAAFRGTTADYILQQREVLMFATLKEIRPNLRLRLNFFAVETEAGSVANKAELLLKEYPNSQLFIASSSAATNSLLQTAKALDLGSKVRIGGFGSILNPALVGDIESGLISVFILQYAKDIGYKSVLAAVALAKGEQVPLVTSTDFFIVTKENVNDPKLKPAFVASK